MASSAPGVVRDPIPSWWLWVALASSVLLFCGCASFTERAVQEHYGPHQDGLARNMAPPQPVTEVTPPQPAAGPSPTDQSQPTGEIQQVSAQQVMPASLPRPAGPGRLHPHHGHQHAAGAACAACGPMGPGAIGPGYTPGPPGEPAFWADEYICDGGDYPPGARPTVDGDFRALAPEDTVAAFETLEGDVRVVPSNKVCIYAPRFAAVRSVNDLGLNAQVVNASGATQPIMFGRLEDTAPPIDRTQTLQPILERGRQQLSGAISDQYAGAVSNVVATFEYHNTLQLFEDYQIIRYGVLAQGEKPMLAQAVARAITWTQDQGAQVILDGQRAQEVVGDQQAQEVTEVHAIGESKLRIVKIASENEALPGEIIHFTLRFDNVGDRLIGNVVIVDNLTTRLEYVEGSAQSSVKLGYLRDEQGQILRDDEGRPRWKQNPVRFTTQVNDADSLTLRWELQEPLPPGEGGIIRFQARVR